MANITTPISFSANTLIKSADVNTNFTNINTQVNGNIDNTNIVAAAAIARSKIAAGTVSQVVINDGAGALSSEAALAASRGGTAQDFSASTGAIIAASGTFSAVAPSSSGNVLTSNGTTWTSAAPASSQVASPKLVNIGISASVGSNILTVALKQADGSTNPSTGTAAVVVGFRNATLTTGGFSEVQATAAVSIATSVGASFGLASAQAQYVYVYAINNAGTLELALAGSKIFDEGTTYNTTTIGAGSTSAVVLYSTTGRTGVAVRLIGRIQCTEATAGTYATTPSEVSLVPFRNSGKTVTRAYHRFDTTNGYGSTNTAILKYTTSTSTGDIATYVTVANDATNGASYTILKDGLYAVQIREVFSSAGNLGLSINSALLTTGIQSIIVGTILSCVVTQGTNNYGDVSTVQYCVAGDVIRPHAGSTIGTGSIGMCKITYLGD